MTDASRLYQSIGINIHANWLSTSKTWGTVNWPPLLTELGIPHVRTGPITNTATLNKLSGFFSAGGKATVIFADNAPNKTLGTQCLAYLKNTVGLKNIAAIEGPNEYNGVTANWAAELRDFAKWTHDTVRADPAFSGIPLIAPSMKGIALSIYQQLGDLSAWCDKGNIHLYNSYNRPTYANGQPMATWLKYAQTLASPIWMTETGWMTGGKVPVSQKAQAKYVLRAYFDAFAHGVEKTFIYELMDDQANLWGIVDAKGAPKQAFSALKNLLALFRDSGAGTGTITPTVSGATSDTRQHLFRKSDGTALLVMYRDVNSAASGGADLNPPPVKVIVAVPGQMTVYQPTFSPSPVQAGSGSLVIPVADHVTVVAIR